MVGADVMDQAALDDRDRPALVPDIFAQQRRGLGGRVVEVFRDPVAMPEEWERYRSDIYLHWVSFEALEIATYVFVRHTCDF